MPTLRADRRGYVLDEESVDGFDDREDLSPVARRQIAKWARRFTPAMLSEEQHRLPAESDEERGAQLELLAAALRDAEQDVPEGVARGFYEDLTDEQLSYVRDPSSHSALVGAGYPLSTKEMGTLTGASGRQLRHWDALGLLPSHRVAGQRRFLSAAVARAFALKGSQLHEVAALAALSRGGPDAARLTRLIAAQVGSLAARVVGSAGSELAQAAATLVTHSRELAQATVEGGAAQVHADAASDNAADAKREASTRRSVEREASTKQG